MCGQEMAALVWSESVFSTLMLKGHTLNIVQIPLKGQWFQVVWHRKSVFQVAEEHLKQLYISSVSYRNTKESVPLSYVISQIDDKSKYSNQNQRKLQGLLGFSWFKKMEILSDLTGFVLRVGSVGLAQTG